MPASIKAAVMPMLILAICTGVRMRRNLSIFIPLWFDVSVEPIKITAQAAALATLTRIGIVRMSGFVDLVSFVS
jgi:hypothetical protein